MTFSIGVKLLDDRFGGAVLRVEGAKESGRGDLAALVDADGQRVLLRHRAFDPASAFGDDPATVQRTVAFLHLDQKVHAGGTVQLVDDDAFGAVDDEFTAADHDGDFTEVDGIFDDLVLVLADEANLNAERHAVGQAKGPAFIGGVARLGEIVADVFQPKVPVVAFDGEDFAKEGFQAVVFPVLGVGVLLQEFFVGFNLNVDQIWNRQRVTTLAEIARFVRSHQVFLLPRL